MNRTFWISGAVVGVLLAALVWASAQSTFLFVHPQAKHVRIVIDPRTGAAVISPRASATVAAPTKVSGQPRAVTPETDFDFGTMNPLTMGRHEFVIRNEGAAPLKLAVGPTTCKCTVSGLANRELAPGQQTSVSLDWNTGRHPEYSHAATIYTNDPERKSIEFSVSGKVLMLLAAEPAELCLPASHPDAKMTAEVLIHSQLWGQFELADVQLGVPGFTWSVEDVDPAKAPHLNARSVKKLHCEFSAPAAQGTFERLLRLEIRNTSEGSNSAGSNGVEKPPQVLTIPVSGSLIRRLAFYGPAISSDGIIDMGAFEEGQSRQVRLIAKVRDPERTLQEVKLHVSPSFVQATWEPHASGQPGMYLLTVEVPAGVAACQYRANPLGKLQIETGHSRIGDVELGVSFAIVPRS